MLALPTTVSQVWLQTCHASYTRNTSDVRLSYGCARKMAPSAPCHRVYVTGRSVPARPLLCCRRGPVVDMAKGLHALLHTIAALLPLSSCSIDDVCIRV